jgi:hypothetical protein
MSSLRCDLSCPSNCKGPCKYYPEQEDVVTKTIFREVRAAIYYPGSNIDLKGLECLMSYEGEEEVGTCHRQAIAALSALVRCLPDVHGEEAAKLYRELKDWKPGGEYEER